jgi:hypothetical protein
MIHCKVISPVRIKGQTIKPGEFVDLSDEEACFLEHLGVVEIVREASSHDDHSAEVPQTEGEGSVVEGLLCETDGIGEGELIGGFVGDDPPQGGEKKRKGVK